MSRLLAWVPRWIVHNPARAASIASGALALALIAGVPTPVVAALAFILTGVLGVSVHGAVMPVVRVKAAIQVTAAEAATRAAAALTTDTVGAVGEVTSAAVNTVADVATAAAAKVLRGVGITGNSHRSNDDTPGA